MKFAYTAVDQNGQQRQGVVEAASDAEARTALRADGLFVTAIHADGSAAPASTAGSGSGKVKKKLETIAAFTRQLQLLLQAGTPLVPALRAVVRQSADPAWRATLEAVIEDLEGGRSLSEALARRPDIFDQMYVGMIDAGEASGDLPGSLGRLAVITRQHVAMNKAVISAITYPVLLVGLAIVTLIGMVIKVVPAFQGLFESIGRPMPPTTQLLLSLSLFLQDAWWAVAIAAGLLLGGLFYAATTPQGVRRVDAAVITLPILGRVMRSLILARIARVLGSAMASKVPLLEAIEITRRATANVHYQELLVHLSNRLAEGDAIADAMRSSPLITPSLAEAIGNGEQSGKLPEVLLGVSDMMDEDNTTLVKSLTGLLEPIILTVLGLVIGGIALSLFLPLFDLTASAGGGP